MGKKALEAVKPRLAKSGRQADYSGLKNAAHTVARFGGRADGAAHLRGCVFIQNRKGLLIQALYILCIIMKGSVCNTSAFQHVCPKGDTLAGKRGHCDGACRNQRRGESAAEMTAAPVIRKPMVFGPGGIIRMTGPRLILELRIICTVRVFVWNEQAQGCTGRVRIKNAALDLDRIRLTTGRGKLALRPAKGKQMLDPLGLDRQAGAKAIEHNADRGPVALSENGQRNVRTNGIFHIASSRICSSFSSSERVGTCRI